MRLLKIGVFLLIFLIITSVSYAQKELPLLSIEEIGNVQKGNIATLEIESVEGTGRVFASTSPLTKVDTQISARFAKDIACDYLNDPCNLDFFYTVEANSAVISGPSAGTAFAIAIIAEIEDIELPTNIAVSATINSGGLLGPVGGLKQKIEAASRRGIDKVLIAKGARFLQNATSTIDLDIQGQFDIPLVQVNEALDLVEFGKALGVEVVEVSRLDEALAHFKKEEYIPKNSEINIDIKYEDTMKRLALQLCQRTDGLRDKSFDAIGDNRTEMFLESAHNKSIRAASSLDNEKYYSAASFCFGANIDLQTVIYSDLADNEIEDIARSIGRIHINKSDISSLQDLQALMIVLDRIEDKDKWILRILEDNKNKTRRNSITNLAYARERLFSALAWTAFFDNSTNDYNIDKELLKEVCTKKFEEAQERFEYASIYFPHLLSGTRENLEDTLNNFQQEKYELCIYQASRVKAESDVVLSLLGVRAESIPLVVDEKIKVAKELIADQKEFPIAAYSYVEYADALKKSSPQTALLYAEYALELADMDIYFPKVLDVRTPKTEFDFPIWGFLLIGIILGILIKKMFLTKRKIRRLIRNPSKYQ